MAERSGRTGAGHEAPTAPGSTWHGVTPVVASRIGRVLPCHYDRSEYRSRGCHIRLGGDAGQSLAGRRRERHERSTGIAGSPDLLRPAWRLADPQAPGPPRPGRIATWQVLARRADATVAGRPPGRAAARGHASQTVSTGRPLAFGVALTRHHSGGSPTTAAFGTA